MVAESKTGMSRRTPAAVSRHNPKMKTANRNNRKLSNKKISSPSYHKNQNYISLESDSNDAVDDDDINLEDICEVVLSLKCRQCDFLCNEKITLAHHVKQNHSKDSLKVKVRKGDGNGSNLKHKSAKKPVFQHDEFEASRKTNKNDNNINVQHKSAQIKEKDITDESNDASETSTDNESKTLDVSNDASEELVEDVFLCAECDVVFSSREMCCSHMHKVHGLKQFSTDFIQEEIIAKPNEQSHNSKNRKTKFPKLFKPDGDGATTIPKKYKVTKFYTCSKCCIKFENHAILRLHEQCHVVSSENCDFDESSSNYGTTQIEKEPDESSRNFDITPVENQQDESSSQYDVTQTEKQLEASVKYEASESKTHKGFLCPLCEGIDNSNGSQIFVRWGACSWHLWKEHRIDCELYTCSICKQFKSHLLSRVKDHELLHSSQSSYKCKTCNKTFKQLKQLRCHEKYHKDYSTKLPPPSDSRWYTPKECPICKRILSDSKCLKKHISAVHNKLKPYVCNICGHTSARKAELQLHIRQHTGEKPYKCPLCPFQTGDHNSLRKHKLRHGDERPYACPYCDYRCIQSCAFKKHIVACHPGQEVVYLCQFCPHASVNETLFLAHQKDHVEERINMDEQSETPSSPERNSSRSSTYTPNSSECESASKIWSGEEDIEIVDTGGVTIPESPDKSRITASANRKKSAKKKMNEEEPELKHTPSNTNSSIKRNPASKKMEGEFRSPMIVLDSPATFIVVKSDERLEKHAMVFDFKEKLGSVTPSQVFCLTASLQPLPPGNSPRHSSTNGSTMVISAESSQDIRGNYDTESTSEVITNPHQLIENIQLTPLDLTDIITCTEQSNDDGMLQRLLDMSGV